MARVLLRQEDLPMTSRGGRGQPEGSINYTVCSLPVLSTALLYYMCLMYLNYSVKEQY